MTEMIRSAQKTTARLLTEDSGIAMPVSLLVFLFLTFICMSVFALSEVIRARTELQYEVDNAAYAAALVQADSLSRIAVLNRALVWTYAQTNKRQMDYIVNRWLSESYDAFVEDADKAELAHIAGCALHTMPPTRKMNPDRHTSGYQISDAMYYLVTNEDSSIIASVLNTEGQMGRLETPLHGLFDATSDNGSVSGKDIYTLKNILDHSFPYGYYQTLEKEIADAEQNMQIMLAQIADIKDNMYNRMKQSVADTLPANGILLYGGDTDNTTSDYFQENIDEAGVFRRYNEQLNSDLTEDWYDRAWWTYDSKSNCRVFNPGYLKLNWKSFGVTWFCKDGAHVATLIPTGSREVHAGVSPRSGQDWGANIQSRILSPGVLDERFFGKNGSIVVAAKKTIPDLFRNLFGTDGFYGKFYIEGNLWAVSAARAGYRIPGGTAYENSKFSDEEQWNLFTDDWDAMFLPVGRCWKTWNATTDKFSGDGAFEVLKALGIDKKLDDKVNLDMLH